MSRPAPVTHRRDSRRRRCRRGFTLIELIAVMTLVGVLAAVVVPRFGVVNGAAAETYRDAVVAGLREAQALSQGHRRLVCAQFDASANLSLRIAANHAATACSHALPGPDAQAIYAHAPAGLGVVVSPARTLYFQSGGTVTASGAGGAASDFTITPTGLAAITVRGLHGLVE
jgi:MSHA pilin protein MshC